MFIKKTKTMLPNVNIDLLTNGFYLTNTLAKEYEKNGVSIIRVSAYSQAEYNRLSKIELTIPYIVQKIKMDDRLEWYSAPKIKNNKPCYAPLNEINITASGDIILCCLDWQKKYTFGNLYRQSLKNILQDQRVYELYNKLSKGDRFLDLCQRCTWSR